MKSSRLKSPALSLVLESIIVRAFLLPQHEVSLLNSHESVGDDADALAPCLRKQAKEHVLNINTHLASEVHVPEAAEHAEVEHHGGEMSTVEQPQLAESGHDEQALELASVSLACFLMGGLPALMIIFYLVNSPVLGIRVATWRVLNMTISIFVAVLLYGTLKDLVLIAFEPSSHEQIAIMLMLFVVIFVGTHAILFFMKEGDETQLQALATILAHISGFFAMYGFADCHDVHSFEELDATGIITLTVGAGVMISVLAYAMDAVMNKIASSDGIVTEEEERWIDACEETNDDVLCLAISFLTVLLVRYLIRGKVEPYEPGKIGNVTQADANILLAISFVFVLLVAVCAIATELLHKEIGSAWPERFTTIAVHLSSMTMGWCILFWAEWQLYVSGWESTIMGGCLVVAIFMTLFSFLCVFLLNHLGRYMRESKMAQRAMKSLELALGLLVGFSWERAFDVGFEEIDMELKREHKRTSHYLIVFMSLVLFVTVFPAWRWHVLPKALQLEKENKRARRASEEAAESVLFH